MEATLSGVTEVYEDFDSFLAALEKPTATGFTLHLVDEEYVSLLYIDSGSLVNAVTVRAATTGDVDRIYAPLSGVQAAWDRRDKEEQDRRDAEMERAALEQRGRLVRRTVSGALGLLKHPLIIAVVAAVVGVWVGSLLP